MRVPVTLGTSSISIAVLYVGFIILEMTRGARQPSPPPLAGGLDEAVVVAMPIVGAAVAVVALLVNWRTRCGWLGLLLNVGCGTAVFVLATLAARMCRVDH